MNHWIVDRKWALWKNSNFQHLLFFNSLLSTGTLLSVQSDFFCASVIPIPLNHWNTEWRWFHWKRPHPSSSYRSSISVIRFLPWISDSIDHWITEPLIKDDFIEKKPSHPMHITIKCSSVNLHPSFSVIRFLQWIGDSIDHCSLNHWKNFFSSPTFFYPMNSINSFSSEFSRRQN